MKNFWMWITHKIFGWEWVFFQVKYYKEKRGFIYFYIKKGYKRVNFSSYVFLPFYGHQFIYDYILEKDIKSKYGEIKGAIKIFYVYKR